MEQYKDPVLSLQWLGVTAVAQVWPRPGNFHMPHVWHKKKKKKKKKNSDGNYHMEDRMQMTYTSPFKMAIQI